MNDRPRGYADIKRLKAATGKKIPDLLALAPNNDPFFWGPAQVKRARWFAELWTRFDLQAGIHLRRIHYKLVSQRAPVLMVDGSPYQNTERCWDALGAASKAARCLGLVAADAFKDARNPEAVLHREYPDRFAPSVSLGRWDEGDSPMAWDLPVIAADLAAGLDWTLPGVMALGYLPSDHDQPFHLELISEKSTVDDVLVPLCAELGANYAPATGFQSISGVIALLKRVRQAGKPCVVFYTSDFDPAGSSMPPAVGRQVEFWQPTYAPGLDVLLLPIVLTKAQVQHYNLPPIPIKESDRRQNNFLAKYAVTGATELDALEALHPGELARVIRAAVAPYRDFGAEQRAREIGWLANKTASDRWADRCRPHAARLEQLQDAVGAIVDGYSERLSALRASMAAELEPFGESLDCLRKAVKTEFAAFAAELELPSRYASPLTLPDPFDGLFDSRRDYLEQLRFYKAAGTDADTKANAQPVAEGRAS